MNWLVAIIIIAVVLVIPVFFLMPHHKLVSDGKIVKKNHQDSWVQFIPMMIGKVTTLRPIYHPESWSFEVSGRDEEGEFRSFTFNATKDEFESKNIGERYP